MKKNNLSNQWSEKTLLMKVLFVLRIMVAVSIIVLAILQLTEVMENADNIFMPLLAVLCMIQSIENWNIQKQLSIFSMLAAIFILLVAALKWIR